MRNGQTALRASYPAGDGETGGAFYDIRTARPSGLLREGRTLVADGYTFQTGTVEAGREGRAAAWPIDNMYVAHIGPGWKKRFGTYSKAVAYAARYGLPAAFVELNLRKCPFLRR